ncbi:MAG: aspartyl-tRNA(Asn)/glutamyl-tRNA(Gln) amidotransferase subunit [Gaiellaceae bacterium]|nr:aspartyl-tRNA(Asn)/glutamyl-tRNA(Gln) amidotransferase subunit [Gaiellaceae bacterium]
MEGIWLARPDEPRAGTPVAIKDLLDTAGLRTTYGSALFVDHVPAESAESVRRLEAAGYAVAGKTNLHEFAYGISSQNEHFGTVPNPAFPGRIAGGSSGGSAAAVAAGEVELALGTDSAGSIRIPAAWCGVVGFKPSYGLVPADGCFPLAPSFDVVGPIASTVGGCEELMRALVPSFAGEDVSRELEVGVAWLAYAEPDVRAGVAAVAERFPRRRTVELPLAPENRADFMLEVADVHRALFPGNEELYGEGVRAKIERCLEVTDAEAASARREREEYRERVEEALAGIDLLVTPSVPFAAPPADVDEATIRFPGTMFTYPFSALGWPALALPPYVQLVGRHGQDALVLAAGRLAAAE